MELIPIGSIHTPYLTNAPFRPAPDAEGEFLIKVHSAYKTALQGLERYSHIIVFFYFDRTSKTNLLVHPPHLEGKETGLFASRSPNRINKIGIDTVKVLRIEDNIIYTSPMDILNNTPLIDIKPYIPDLDCYPGK